MSSLSQFLASAALPVGSVVRMSSSVNQDLITQNGAEYLRIGKLVSYQNKYATAASRGLILNRWPASVTLGGNIPTDMGIVANRKMFAKGTMGRLTWHGGEYYTFTGYNNVSGSTVGITAPIVLKTPPIMANFQRLFPSFCSDLDMWVVIDVATTVAGLAYLYTSKDGTNWKTTVYPQQSFGITTASYASIGCTKTHAFIAISSASSNLQIYKVGISALGDGLPPVLVTNYSTAYLPTWNSGYTVGPDDAVILAGSSTTLSALCFDDSLTADRNYQSSSSSLASYMGLLFDRNPTTGMIAFVIPYAAAGNIYTGTRIGNMTAGYALGAITSSSANLTFLFTGTYWIFLADIGGTNTLLYSSNDTTSWTAYSTGITGVQGTSRGVVFKNHVLLPKASNWKVFQLATGTESGTLPPVSNNFGYLIQTISFAGNSIALRDGCISQTTANYAGEDIKWWNSTWQSPINYLSRFKTVNSRLFVTNLATGSVLSSADGIAWTKVDIAGLTVMSDITYINSRYVVTGTGGSNNTYYSADLSTWTAGGVLSTATTPYPQVFTIGTAAVALSTTTTPRRTTDGSTWATIATLNITPMTNISNYVEGTTAYVFAHTSASSGCIRYTSTDSGATWASTTTNIKGSGASTYPVPHSITKYNNLYYAIVGSKAHNDSSIQYGVYTSTDLITWTAVNFLSESRITPTDQIASIYTDPNGVLMLNFATSNASGVQDQSIILEGISGGYIGAQESPALGAGEVGYVRIA